MSERAGFIDVDEQKLRRVFLEEAEEQLESLGAGLLALEKDTGSAELVHEVFRLVHNLKSASAMNGLNRLSELAHALEDVLASVRGGALALGRPLMDAIFTASDLLHELVGRVAREGSDESVDTASTVAELRAAAGLAEGAGGPPGGQGSAPDGAGEPLRLEGFQRAQVLEALERGESLYRVEVQVDPEAQIMYPRAYLVFNVLETATNVLCSAPDMAAAPGQDELYRRAVFLLTSSLPESRLREMCSLDLIREVQVQGWDRAAAGASGLLEAEGAPPGELDAAEGSPPAGPAGPRGAGTGPAGGESDSVRVSTRKLDEIWQLVGELVTFKAELGRVHEGVLRVAATEAGLGGEIDRAGDALERIAGEMQQAIMQTRMVPIAVLFKKFRRLVRDQSRRLGKQAELEIVGEETEIDRTIVEALSDPLTHVVRNCLDHGLEPPEERRRAGKAETGRIRISAQQLGGKIVVEVEDDGRGLDLERIRQKAGLSSDAAREDLIQAVFQPGFSTKDDVTDLSGRGVGMDVVATRIRDQLKGEVELHTEQGGGTVVRLLLPLTLTILHSLIVRSGDYLYAIPVHDIEETVKVPRGSDRYAFGGREIPLLRLSALVGDGESADEGQGAPAGDQGGAASAEASAREGSGVVVAHRRQRACLLVEELVEEQDIVIKPVAELLNSRRLFSGVSVLGDGTVLFILDTARIVSLGSGGD